MCSAKCKSTPVPFPIRKTIAEIGSKSHAIVNASKRKNPSNAAQSASRFSRKYIRRPSQPSVIPKSAEEIISIKICAHSKQISLFPLCVPRLSDFCCAVNLWFLACSAAISARHRNVGHDWERFTKDFFRCDNFKVPCHDLLLDNSLFSNRSRT